MADSDSVDKSTRSSPIRLSYKTIAYVIAWIAALLATNPSCSYWALAWMFPLGLAAVIDLHAANDGGWGVFALCVAIYLVHGYFYFRAKTLRSVMIWFVLLVILLVGNVSGCRSMLPGR